jgi:hypothetical protein
MKQSPWINATEGQKPKATHCWLGKGHRMGLHMWRHPIGVLKSSFDTCHVLFSLDLLVMIQLQISKNLNNSYVLLLL